MLWVHVLTGMTKQHRAAKSLKSKKHQSLKVKMAWRGEFWFQALKSRIIARNDNRRRLLYLANRPCFIFFWNSISILKYFIWLRGTGSVREYEKKVQIRVRIEQFPLKNVIRNSHYQLVSLAFFAFYVFSAIFLFYFVSWCHERLWLYNLLA